ncbi:MAG: NAD-dependent epimerase/dehydratase family protein, partial [Roseibium sp.]|uniref:NAD-dependent epimerase/dehydratase family protein n=1 Tax=Roseibium sp. TaxID=1936156 RepID=UPI00260226C7
MKKAIVLGAYGFIGAACVRALQTSGYRVTGVGRSEKIARRTFPDLEWIIADITKNTIVNWRSAFDGTDVVVNASGALQDGARDDLVAIHETAV